MFHLALGLLVIVATGSLFWKCLPRGGRPFRFANTEWEPYIAVGLSVFIVFGFAMVLAGVFETIG